MRDEVELETLIFMFLAQFDATVEFLNQGCEVEKQRLVDFMIEVLQEARGSKIDDLAD